MALQQQAPQPRYKKLQARYDLLSSRVTAGTSLVPDTAYADFLREHEQQTLPNAVPDPVPSGGRGKEGRKPLPLSANTVRQRAQHSINESSKRLKAIEDHMWQHRQEERELKRAELDMQKQRRNIQRAMKEYEHKVSEEQEREAQTLFNQEEGLATLQRRELHRKEAATREHTQLALAGRQRVNEQTKKFMKTENELSWRYQNLLQSLDHKRSEVEQLSNDFEARIRSKEEEQHKLKQELANLAITLSMEAQRTRRVASEDTRTSTKTALKEIKDSRSREEGQRLEERSKVAAGTRYENSKRGLEQGLKSRQERLQAQQRQGGRNLLDVRSKLQQNAEHQRFTQKEAEHVQLDIAGQDSHTKLQEVEARKRAMADSVQRRMSSENAREEREWRERYSSKESELRRRAHEEQLKRLSRVVSRYDSTEQELYSQARQAEAERSKHSQALTTLQTDLNLLKRANARKLKQAALEAEKAELELHQKILREAAEKTRATSSREESLHTLTAHRLRAKEDRTMLADEKREHQRRVRIANRTVLLGQAT